MFPAVVDYMGCFVRVTRGIKGVCRIDLYNKACILINHGSNERLDLAKRNLLS